MSKTLDITIPKEWNVIKFEEVIQKIKRGESKRTNNQKKGVLYLTSDYIQDGRINWDIQKYLVTDKDITPYLLEKNDLIINCVNSFAKVGKVALFEGHTEPVVIGFNNFAVHLNSDEIYPKFLVFFLNSKRGYSEIIRIIKPAINQVSFSSKDLNIIRIILPPLNEQIKISKILENIDNIINNKKDIIESLQRLKKGLMQRLFTEGIGHTEFKETKWGKIPKEWDIKRISEIGKVIGGGTPDTKNEDYWNGEVLWATPTDITNLREKFIFNTKRKISNLGLEKSSAKILPSLSLLMTSRASIGFCAINLEEICTNQGFQNIIPNEKINVEFLYYTMQTQRIQNILNRYAYGSTFLEIPNKVVKKIKIYVPNMEEQKKIVQILSNIDDAIENDQNYSDILKEIKKGLMQDLLTGKKRVKLVN